MHTPLLISKLIPPVPTANHMRRQSLNKKLLQVGNAKLTLLHSGAGYGKSSTLAQYFLDVKTSHTWYTVTEEDDDILPFLRHLLQSVRRTVPNFGNQSIEWEIPSMFPKEEELQIWLAQFINALYDVKETLYIVLDDFHLVDHVFLINYMMERILEFLPQHVHLMIATRSRPKWTSLVKLKLNGHLIELTEEDFVFKEEEILVFFEDYFDTNISISEASSIMDLTEGWPIAINLLAMQMSDVKAFNSLTVKPAMQDLFSYLADEVFNNMTKEEQHSILLFAIFPSFSNELITEFYGEEASAKLMELADRHVFIQPLREMGSYRFHALFQQFLENKWLSSNKTEYLTLHKRASHHYLDDINTMLAVHHALKTTDQVFIAEVLSKTANDFIKFGQFDFLFDVLRELPKHVREHYYSLYYFEGESQRYRAYYEKARQAYVKCLIRAEENHDLYYVSRANAGLAHIYLDTIQPGLAEPYLIEAISVLERSGVTSQKEMALLKRQFAENLVNLGKAADAAEWVVKEQLEPSILVGGNLDARILLRSGQLMEAEKILINRDSETHRLPDSHRETDILLSLIYSMTGRGEEAKESATNGIEIGRKEKSGFVEAVGLIRKGHAEVLLDPLDLTEAEKNYHQANKIMEDLNVSRGKSEALMGLSLLKTRLGAFDEAFQYAEDAIRGTEKVNDQWLSGLIRIGFTMIHYYSGDYSKSIESAKMANEIFNRCGDRFGEMLASFWEMTALYKLENYEEFLTQAKKFTSIYMEHKFEFFLQSDTMFGPIDRQIIYPMLIKAKSLDEQHPSILYTMGKLHITNLTNHTGYRIIAQLFGPFTIWLGTHEVSDRGWQRDKAKELFLYLLLNRDRFIPREEITRALWEESKEVSADRDFKVALNALLKVLEPHRNAREESFFIQRKQTMYRLNTEAIIISDLDRFKLYAERGIYEHHPVKAKELLLKAVSLYKGTLFEEKPSLEWLEHDRRQIEKQYINVLERLAQTSTRLKEFEHTIYWAEKLLRIDHTWEEAYRLLMYAHYQLQNRPQAVKWYERCVEVLEDELNIHPMETTVQMYEMITNVT